MYTNLIKGFFGSIDVTVGLGAKTNSWGRVTLWLFEKRILILYLVPLRDSSLLGAVGVSIFIVSSWFAAVVVTAVDVIVVSAVDVIVVSAVDVIVVIAVVLAVVVWSFGWLASRF